jgi:site-specific recombinase
MQSRMLARSVSRLVAAAAVALTLALAAPAVASAAYGAIAINRSTAAWGLAYRAPARWYAERQALRKCPGNCSVITWVFDQCAAVVETPRTFVSGAGPGKLAAIHNARMRAHDHNARFIAWVCSG